MQKWLPIRVLSVVAMLAGSAVVVRANSGTLLPLDQYQPGTEHVQNTIVTNGNFESAVGNQPNNWVPLGTFQDAAPIGPNTSVAVNGTHAAQGPLGSPIQRNGYRQIVALAPNTDYVLSAYAWNFSPQNFDLTLVELRDSVNNTLVKNFSLAPSDVDPGDGVTIIDGSRGVFGSKLFNSSFFPSGSAVLEVAFEYDANFPFPQGRPSISGQIDNVAITPASLFVPPTRIPEPGSALLIVGLGALGGLRRRPRQRVCRMD